MVTVFGGTGFVGRQIVQAVLRAGLPVRVASRHPPRNSIAGDGAVSHVTADIRDEQAVLKAVEGATAVVNAVSLYVEKGDATFAAVHVEGAQRVARCASDAGANILIHISGLGVDATSPSRFVRARAQGEQGVRAAFERSVAIRPSVIFGRDDHFLTAIEQATRLPVVPLFGKGETRLQPVYVGDVAAAVTKLIQNGYVGRSTYELGGPQTYAYRELLKIVMAHLRRRRPLLPVPFSIWRMMASVFAVLPSPPLTRDQILLMEKDNVVSGREPTFSDLGLQPVDLVSMLSQCLPAWAATLNK